MPNIRRQNLPPALLQHLLDRIQQREIFASQLGLLALWLDQRALRCRRANGSSGFRA